MKTNNKPSIVFEDEDMIKYLGITQKELEIIMVQRYPSCVGRWIVIRDNNIITINIETMLKNGLILTSGRRIKYESI